MSQNCTWSYFSSCEPPCERESRHPMIPQQCAKAPSCSLDRLGGVEREKLRQVGSQENSLQQACGERLRLHFPTKRDPVIITSIIPSSARVFMRTGASFRYHFFTVKVRVSVRRQGVFSPPTICRANACACPSAVVPDLFRNTRSSPGQRANYMPSTGEAFPPMSQLPQISALQ